MQVRPKYQVFISSTYSDLHEERKAVAWAILKTRNIPAGMENFTASDDRGWRTITSVIDKTDYFVLILGGRYGSLDENGMSWTEREYHYATKMGIPILAFVREKSSITADLLDDNVDLAKKLEAFKSHVRQNHLTVGWSTIEQLENGVAVGLNNIILDDEDRGISRPGWYRGNEIPDLKTLDEFARLSADNQKLRDEILHLSNQEQLNESLALVDRDEQLLQETNEIQRILMFNNETGRMSLTQMYGDHWDALAINIYLPIELGITNTGNSIVEHVVVDLELNDIIGISCGYYGKVLEIGKNFKSENVSQKIRYKCPDEILLIDSKTVRLRFRIPRIVSGATEYLPKMVAFGSVENQHSCLTFKYKLSGSSCRHTTGSVDYKLTFSRYDSLSPDIFRQEVNRVMRLSELNHLPSAFFTSS